MTFSCTTVFKEVSLPQHVPVRAQFFLPFQAGKSCNFLADFVHKTPLLDHCACVHNTHKEKMCFGLCTKEIWKILGFNPNPPLQEHWHCHMVTICPSKLSQYYTLADSHNVALECHKLAKILHATMWRKIVAKWQNYTCYNVAKNCHNLRSEFTVCDISDKNVAFLFSSRIG